MEAALLWVLAGALVAVGIVGLVVPAMPGTPLVFLGLLLGAWIDGFTKVGGFTVAILGALAALAWLVDFAASALGARRVGASTLAIVGAVLGTVAGLFFGLPGLLLGPLLGAVAGELLSGRDTRQAAKAGIATWVGLVVAIAAKLSLALSMIGLFVAAYFLN
jgi:uncharacterized protein YqgC (DUF456 family)